MTSNHNKFLEKLERSDLYVWYVAKWLHKLGYSVSVPVNPKAPRPQVWKEYADQGDLHVLIRVEVKAPEIVFTGKDDWPYKEFYVCNKYQYDRSEPKPQMFFIMSQDGKYAGMVNSETLDKWFEKEIIDDYGRKKIVYCCPLDMVKWIQITE